MSDKKGECVQCAHHPNGSESDKIMNGLLLIYAQ